MPTVLPHNMETPVASETSETSETSNRSVIVVIKDTPKPAMAANEFLEFAAGRHKTTALKHKLSTIDAKTNSLITQGYFIYEQKIFSLSATAQFNTLVMYTRRNDPDFIYPVLRSTKDSLSMVRLPDATAIEAFYTASENTVRAFLDAGNFIKAQVAALETLAEIIAFVDIRS